MYGLAVYEFIGKFQKVSSIGLKWRFIIQIELFVVELASFNLPMTRGFAPKAATD